MESKPKFSEDEQVLCHHNDIWYEAKVMEVEISEPDKVVTYLIHYKGWNKKWDEWVTADRLKVFDETMLKGKSGKSRKVRAKSKPEPTDTTPKPSPKTQKTTAKDPKSLEENSPPNTQTSVPPKMPEIPKCDITLNIPDELKETLNDDFNAIIRQSMITSVPAKMTVDQILNNYVKSITADSCMVVMEPVVQCIQNCFDAILGSQLLYKIERPQYAEILKKFPDTKMSQIYGAYHLLRLFVKFGPIIAASELDEKAAKTLVRQFEEFLEYLAANKATLFSMEQFENMTPEYERAYGARWLSQSNGIKTDKGK